MGIREDFEKDFDKEFPEYYPTDEFLKSVALWAVKWMAERCADLAKNGRFGDQYKDCPAAWVDCTLKKFEGEIRQLAKSLED